LFVYSKTQSFGTMGSCCPGGSDEENDRLVTKELDHDKKDHRDIKKLLLLGAGSSGKTTFFKQLKCIHGNGFSHKDKQDYQLQIENQIIEQMQKLIVRGRELIEDYGSEYGNLEIKSNDARESASIIAVLRRDNPINDEIANHIEILWNDIGIRNTFKLRAKLAIPDSCEHFFNSIRRISNIQYLPTDEDILLVRKRTTGIIEEYFTIKETKFHIFDVGGQRNERKKWIHCFENVTSVIFVASLSCYDESLLEDETVNVMDETLNLFAEVCNLRWFEKTPFILFLNKKDLFEKKITQVPLSTCFEDFNGGSNYEAALDYIKQQFNARCRQDGNKKGLYIHVTWATNKQNVEKVFNDVQHIVVHSSLHRGGLL